MRTLCKPYIRNFGCKSFLPLMAPAKKIENFKFKLDINSKKKICMSPRRIIEQEKTAKKSTNLCQPHFLEF